MGVEDGPAVTAPAADGDEADPALGAFLDLLARDIATRPGALVPLDEALFARIDTLTQGVVVDPDEPIEGEVEL